MIESPIAMPPKSGAFYSRHSFVTREIMTQSINQLVKPIHSQLRKPETGDDWDKVVETASRIIDNTPEDAPVSMQMICGNVAVAWGIDVTYEEIRNVFSNHDCWEKYLCYYLSQNQL